MCAFLARPTVIVFDVNETLSDMSTMAERFAELGAPAHRAPLWFATLLRDGFALTAAGASRPFADLAADALRAQVADVDLRVDPALGLDGSTDAAVRHVLDGFGRLPLHPDVAAGVRQLRADGYRLVTLTNGSVAVSGQLLSAAGVRDEFEAVLSVQDAGAWKPARIAYEYAARVCGTDPGDMLLVAAHPWDVDGAARAGLRTAWIDRGGAPYPESFTAPTWSARGVDDLRTQLGVSTRRA